MCATAGTRQSRRMATAPARTASTRTAGARPDPTPARRPRRLGGPKRKAFLLVHILTAGIWLGVDVIVGMLVFGAWLSDDPGTRDIAYRALGGYVLWPMLLSGLLCLVSGIVLGVGSKYGLVRYVWVAVKLVLNLVLCLLIIVLLRPMLAQLAAGQPGTSDLVYPPVVSVTALTFASWLSVFKPWGLTPRGRAVSGR
jgi:hypothetical protein